ncbi:MAG: hypothetical protein ACKPKO_11585, partial [Candidatus Fonsibacter sp.]
PMMGTSPLHPFMRTLLFSNADLMAFGAVGTPRDGYIPAMHMVNAVQNRKFLVKLRERMMISGDPLT